MHSRLKREATQLAAASPLQEICGFALYHGDGSVALQPCVNVASDPTTEFEISSEDTIKAARSGRILWVYHSHPKGPSQFSPADIEYSEESTLPQWMYDLATDSWHEYIPTTHFVALEGRPFIWGEQDCYSLLRDYYRQHPQIQIHINDYDRDETSPWPDLGRLVLQQIDREGFVALPPNTPLKKHDILILLTHGSPQHFAIFQGNSTILHHRLGMLSRQDQYTTEWQKKLHCVARYRNRALS